MPLGPPKHYLFALALAAFSCAANAKREEPAHLNLPADATAVQLAAQREQIERAIKNTEQYAELRASDGKRVRDLLDGMASQLEAAGSLAALPEADRRALLEEQDSINAVLGTAYGDSRLVCKREKEIGSNFRRTVCMTVAQRRKMSDDAQMMGEAKS